MRTLLCFCYVSMIIADAVVFRIEPSWIETWEFWFGIAFIGSAILIAAWLLAHQDWIGATFFAIAATWAGVSWWHRTRRRRRKLADRGAGIIVDVGGRLKVVRAPVTERCVQRRTKRPTAVDYV